MPRTDLHISKALDEVVMRALCKSKAQRYQTAAEMAADLRKTITHPRGGFVVYPEVNDGALEDRGQAQIRRRQSERRRALKLLLLYTGGVVLLAALTILVLYVVSQNSGVRIPALEGMPQEAAVEILENMEMQVSVVNAYSENYEAGCVMLQSAEADSKLRRNSEIVLTISLGTQWYDLPDMTGWDLSAAAGYLENAGAAKVNLEYVQSREPVGTVVSTDHAPGSVSRDEMLTLRISGESVLVPSLTGLTLEGAQAVIEAEGLHLGAVAEGQSADAKSGSVIDQSVAPYTQVLTDSVIDLTVCQPQEIRFAPDSPLTLAVPLNGMRVSISLTTPSGQNIEAFAGELDAGTHSVSLTSSETGLHSVRIYMGDVLFEGIDLIFE